MPEITFMNIAWGIGLTHLGLTNKDKRKREKIKK